MSEFIIAVHALVCLSHTRVSKSSEELSMNLCTNPVRIRKVMAKCKKKNLVITKAGINGGYFIARPGSEINLKQIYEAVDIPLLESKWHSGDIDAECMIASGMSTYIDELFSGLNNELINMLEFINLDMIEDRLNQINENKKGNK